MSRLMVSGSRSATSSEPELCCCDDESVKIRLAFAQ
jgi:hypothetical protein